MNTADRGPVARGYRFSLYRKLALTFLLVLTLLAVVYGYLTATLINRYFEATYQRLNRDVAAHIVKFMAPFDGQGVNPKGADEIFFNAMVTNPSAEVYLLDSAGVIKLFHAPAARIKRKQVSLDPIRRYVQSGGTVFIKGDNPKNEREQTIFSAASVIRNGRLQGYVYVILTSTDYGSTMGILRQNYVVKWGVGTMLITLLAALAIGLIAAYRLTKNLSYVISRVQQFQEGDLSARIQVKPNSELTSLAETFNTMAVTLSQNIDQLRLSEQLRRTLVATISHDLRTPMAAVHGYAEILVLKKTLSDAQKAEYAGIVLQSTNKLIKLVDELFELSKLEARETQPHREPFAVAELVMELVTKFRLIARQKQIDLLCEDCRMSTLCLADVGLIERVLQNLIENAIRYAPVGSAVRVEVLSGPTDMTVSIENPVGDLPEPVRSYLHSNSTSGDTSPSVRPAGVGFGLAIVRRILDLHDSQLTTSSGQAYKTIRFTFSLPVYQLPG